MCTPSPGGVSITVDGPTVTCAHDPEPLVPLRFPLCVVHPVGLDKRNDVSPHHRLTALNILCVPPVPLSQTLETTDTFPVFSRMSFGWNHIHPFQIGFFDRHLSFLRIFTWPDELVSF